MTSIEEIFLGAVVAAFCVFATFVSRAVAMSDRHRGV